jgi:hypothetical protein
MADPTTEKSVLTGVIGICIADSTAADEVNLIEPELRPRNSLQRLGGAIKSQ